MRTIAIVLCDNDFGNTFKPLLELIHRVYLHHDGYNNTLGEEYIALLIREAIPFHYLAFQNFPDRAPGDVESVNKYLSRIKILFDEEAEKHIEANDHDGGSWYLELDTGYVFSY